MTGAALLSACVSACSVLSGTHPHAASSRPPQATPDQSGPCEDLRAQIRAALASARQAPATSIDEDIVAAREAKADQKLDELRTQYAQLDCPSEQEPPAHSRMPLPPPAPGGPSSDR